jgi:hypothetical protein
MSGPDPAVYDAFVWNDYWKCSGAASHCSTDPSTNHDHQATSDQMADLLHLWTEDPLLCWDGNQPPCPNPLPGDDPYRLQMHLYNGVEHDLAEDAFGNEIPEDGHRLVHSYYLNWFPERFRYTDTFRYVLATHSSGGQGDSEYGFRKPGRLMVWGNTDESAVYWTYSHEMAHLLGVWDLVTHDENSGDPCPGVVNQCVPGGAVWTEEPLVNSLTSYFFKGYLAKSSSPPTGDPKVVCQWTKGRFSKGLNETLEEHSLSETIQQTWASVKLAQDLFCFNDKNFCDGSGRDNAFDPHCDGTHCFINWDGRQQSTPLPQEPYEFDVSYGRLVKPAPLGVCAQDDLKDRNELLAFMVSGKDGLKASEDVRKHFTIYADTFNSDTFGSGTTSNIAGWDFPIETTVQFERAWYPAEVCTEDLECVGCRDSGDCGHEQTCTEGTCTCTANSDCPRRDQSCEDGLCTRDRTCKFDTCTSNGDCVSGFCYSGVCLCATDNQCNSAWCDGGHCSVARGACSCTTDGECLLDLCELPREVCDTAMGAARSVPDKNAAPLDSARFTGTAAGGSIVLRNQGSSSPLWTIGDDHEEFILRFDLRFDGFTPGHPQQVLFRFGTPESPIQASIYAGFDGPHLMLEVPGYTLYYPGLESGRPLDVHRWYRVVWGVSPTIQDHFLSVRAWDFLSGWYDLEGKTADSGCVWRDRPPGLPSTGDLRIGYDGTTDGTRFRGLMDNVLLRNYRAGTDDRPSPCEHQQ